MIIKYELHTIPVQSLLGGQTCLWPPEGLCCRFAFMYEIMMRNRTRGDRLQQPESLQYAGDNSPRDESNPRPESQTGVFDNGCLHQEPAAPRLRVGSLSVQQMEGGRGRCFALRVSESGRREEGSELNPVYFPLPLWCEHFRGNILLLNASACWSAAV